MSAAGPSPDLRARILSAVREAPSPPRAAGMQRDRLAVAFGFAILGVVWLRLGVFPGTRPLPYIVALVAAWLGVAAIATWAGVYRGRSMLGRPQRWKAAVAALTPIAMLALWWPIAERWPRSLECDSGVFAIAQCLVGTALLGIGPLLAFVYVNRGSEPTRPWLTGAALGAAAGAWGAVALVVICRHASASHMVIGHVTPVALLALVGAALGSRALAIRSDRG